MVIAGNKKLKINEIFDSIQGEGKYQGYPVTFIRLSGCDRCCTWCDSKYHTKGEYYNLAYLKNKLSKYENRHCFVVTGGEPLLQYINLVALIRSLKSKKFIWMLETNGDYISDKTIGSNKGIKTLLKYFSYISISPKEEKVAYKVWKLRNKLKNKNRVEIKVVTDLENVGLLMLKYATSLMPLTVSSKEKSLEISQKVWNYCVKHNLHFSSRLHYLIWGNKRKK